MSSTDYEDGWKSVGKSKSKKTKEPKPEIDRKERSRPPPPPQRQTRPEANIKNPAKHSTENFPKKTKSVIPIEMVTGLKGKNTTTKVDKPQEPKKSKKPRPAESMALMDIIEAQLKSSSAQKKLPTHKKIIPENHSKKGHHSSDIVKIVRSKDPLNSEFKAVTKKKKKKLSTVKKRVLMERLNRHVKHMIESGQITSMHQTESMTGSSRVIALLNFITEDMQDEDEVAEMMLDARELLAPFGEILDMATVCSFPSQAEERTELHVSFSSPTEAYAAACALDGLVMGGEAIQTRIVDGEASWATRGHMSVSSQLPSQEHSQSYPEESKGHIAVHSVALWNVVSAEDVLDEDEAEEVLADIRYLCEAYGQPLAISIVHPNPELQLKLNNYIPTGYQYVKCNREGSLGMDSSRVEQSISAPTPVAPLSFPVVFIRCTDIGVAVTAARKLEGTVMGGSRVSVSLFDNCAFDKAIYKNIYQIEIPHNSDPSFGLRVWMDVEEEGLTPERRGGLAVKYFQERIANSRTRLVDGTIHTQLIEKILTCDIYAPPHNSSIMDVDAAIAYDVILGNLSFEECLAVQQIIQYGEPVEHLPSCEPFCAVRIDICSLKRSQKVWGSEDVYAYTVSRGNYLSTQSDSSSSSNEDKFLPGGCILAVSGFLTEDDVMDAISFPEEIAALKSDLMEVLGVHTLGELDNWSYCKSCVFVTEERVKLSEERVGASDSVQRLEWTVSPYVQLDFATAQEARNVLFAFDGSVMGGEVVVATLSEDERSCVTQAQQERVENKTSTVGDAVVEALPGAQKVTAAEAPKLPRHSGPADSQIPTVGDDGKAIIKEMLQTLSTLQARAKEKDPNNYKKRERFVMGIKQAANTVKSRRCRVLLLAPDTEESEVLDAKIADMIQDARSHEIPIVYALKRRQLGKAAGATMKQSVVSVCNIDGAEKQYKALLEMIGYTN